MAVHASAQWLTPCRRPQYARPPGPDPPTGGAFLAQIHDDIGQFAPCRDVMVKAPPAISSMARSKIAHVQRVQLRQLKRHTGFQGCAPDPPTRPHRPRRRGFDQFADFFAAFMSRSWCGVEPVVMIRGLHCTILTLLPLYDMPRFAWHFGTPSGPGAGARSAHGHLANLHPDPEPGQSSLAVRHQATSVAGVVSCCPCCNIAFFHPRAFDAGAEPHV